MKMEADVVIVGTGVGGLFSALSLPRDQKIIMITKSDLESSDSFLAQGGICVLTDENDYDNYFSTNRRKYNGFRPFSKNLYNITFVFQNSAAKRTKCCREG